MTESKTEQELKKQIASLTKRINKIEQILVISQDKISPVEEIAPIETPATKTTVSTSHNFEENLGFKWFSRIGILALVLGVAFFIKYAFDNNLISYLHRIILGVAGGLLMIIGGEILAYKKENYKEWAKRIVAGGFAITYFAVYSAYHFTNYRAATGISLSLDIILLSIVVIGGVLIAIKDDSKVFAGSAFLLGFLTAFLGNSIENLTLVYGLLLSIGLLVVTLYKKWFILGIGGVFATYALYVSWYDQSANMENFTFASIFLISYFTSYAIQTLAAKEEDTHPSILAGLNSALFYSLYLMLIEDNFAHLDGLFTWIMGVGSFALYLVARFLNKTTLRFTYLALAIFFATVTIFLELEDQWLVLALAIEALTLGIVGTNLNIKILRAASYIVATITFLAALFFMEITANQTTQANLIAKLPFIAIAYFSAIFIENKIKSLNTLKFENLMPGIYSFFGTVITAFFIAEEFEKIWISVGWAITALLLTTLGFIIKQRSLRIQGILLFGFTILKVFAYDTSELDTLYRTISFMALGIILLLVSFGYNKYKDRLKELL